MLSKIDHLKGLTSSPASPNSRQPQQSLAKGQVQNEPHPLVADADAR